MEKLSTTGALNVILIGIKLAKMDRQNQLWPRGLRLKLINFDAMLVKYFAKFKLAGRGVFMLLLFFLFSNGLSAQISDGTVKPDDKKTKRTRAEKDVAFEQDSLTGTNFYLSGIYQYSHRTFEDQSGFDFYEDWEDQTSDYNYGGSMGLLMDLAPHFQLDIGVTYFGHSENHVWADSLTDSTYTYQNTYLQMAVPLRLRYVYGEKWQIFGFAGIAPLNIMKLRYESSYTTADGLPVDRETEIRRDGFATFNLMISTGLGLCYNIRYVGFTIYPEFRRHLFNTYSTKTISVDHKMYSIGVNAGIVLHF